MPTGSGAFIVHKMLEANIPGYKLTPYNPWLTLFPPALCFLRDRKADLIHTVADYAFFLAPPTAPLVITFQNFVLDRFMKNFSSRLQWLHYRTDLTLYIKLALRRAHAVTAVSEFTSDLVRRETGYSGNIHIIPNGVDVNRFVPRPDTGANRDEIRVLFSGNPTTRKGAQWLRAIAENLQPGVKIACASGLANRWNITESEHIDVLGKIPFDKMADLYRSSDILLMPTVREGLSLSILEAMACGLPVVTTDCSSMPEQIEHGKGGFLCKLGDAEDFASRINQLAGSEQMRLKMGRHNRTIAESRFSLERMVKSYQELFSTFI